MTQTETITRDTWSYRRGLVLGLTMAEVFLLLVFALLIALAVLWHSERQKHPPLDAADSRLLEDIRAAKNATSTEVVSRAIDGLKKGLHLEPVTQAEKDFITEVRVHQSAVTPEEISDQWRTLTRAVVTPRKGLHLEPISQSEKDFITEVRAHQFGVTPEDISDQWRALTQAAPNLKDLDENTKIAELVKSVLPKKEDWMDVIVLLKKGLQADGGKGEHDWPPIINLSEANGHFFERGKAELNQDFETHLRNVIVPLLVKRVQEYGVSTIEVIGHTDDQKIALRNSNLDAFLLNIMRNNAANVSSLIPADNAGLGLARAAAVVRVLARDERLKSYTLLPLSGGQLIGEDDRLTNGDGGDEPGRRRIEIRLRRANVSETPQTARPPIITPARPRSPTNIALPPSPRAVTPSKPSPSTGSIGCAFFRYC
jgi:flagellar motor protein MotB